jgi:hypothetical protein
VAVTWDAGYFANSDTLVKISAILTPSGISLIPSVSVPAKQGFVPLTITDYYLQGLSEKTFMLMLTYTDEDSISHTLNGTRLTAIRADFSVVTPVDSPAPSSGPNTLAIALPVVLGLLALGVVGWFLWRRYRQKLVIAGIRRRSSQGYGVSKSRSQRVNTGGTADTKGGVGIQLDESPVSPTPGRNVFREEVQRQERERT